MALNSYFHLKFGMKLLFDVGFLIAQVIFSYFLCLKCNYGNFNNYICYNCTPAVPLTYSF